MAHHQPSTSQAVQATTQASTGYTLQDEYFGRLFKAVTQTSPKVLRRVLLDILPPSFSGSLSDYFTQCLHLTNADLKKIFNTNERQVLQKSIYNAGMDVTLLCKVIQTVFDKLNVLQELKNALKDIKDMRNTVCHEPLQLNKTQFKDYMTELKTKFGTLIHHVQNVLGITIDGSVYDVEVDTIESTLIEPLKYFTENEEYRSIYINHFKGGKTELKKFYSTLQVPHPLPWLCKVEFAVDKIFTDPSITDDRGRNINLKSLLITEKVNPMTQETILPKVLLLTGIAGSGKTSLCRFLLNDWVKQQNKVTNLDSIDILLYIEARIKTRKSVASLLQTYLMQNTCHYFEEEMILLILGRLNILYVIDGFDESTAEARELIQDVFFLGKSEGSRILITTRSEYESQVIRLSQQQYHLFDMKLEVHGFSEQGKNTFTSRMFKVCVPDEQTRHQEEKQFLNFLRNSHESLSNLLSLPLTLAFFILLWQDNKQCLENINSGTRLYSRIFEMLSSKLKERLPDEIQRLDPAQIQEKLEFILPKLGEISFGMLKADKLIIDEKVWKELRSQLTSQHLPGVEVLSAFLRCEMYADTSGEHHHFSFVHKSQMEYLAALYITDTLLEVCKSNTTAEAIKTKLITIGMLKDTVQEWDCKWLNTWLFVIGHLCLREVEDDVLKAVMEALLSSRCMMWNVKTIYRLLHESGMHKQVIQQIEPAMTCDSTEWSPNVYELNNPDNYLAVLLRNTPISPFGMCIDLSLDALLKEDGSLNTAACENMKNTFILLSERPSCKVKLDLGYSDLHDRRYYYQEMSDHVMRLIPRDMKIVQLRGPLGPEGAAVLASFDKIKELNVTVYGTDAIKPLNETLRQREEAMERVNKTLIVTHMTESSYHTRNERLRQFYESIKSIDKRLKDKKTEMRNVSQALYEKTKQLDEAMKRIHRRLNMILRSVLLIPLPEESIRQLDEEMKRTEERLRVMEALSKGDIQEEEPQEDERQLLGTTLEHHKISIRTKDIIPSSEFEKHWESLKTTIKNIKTNIENLIRRVDEEKGVLYLRLEVIVDTAQALHALAVTSTQLTVLRTYLHLTLKLSLQSLPALPRLSIPLLRIYLEEDVHDATAKTVAEALAQLQTWYSTVWLHNSRLTAKGLNTFVTTLRDRRVVVRDRLGVRTSCNINQSDQERLKAILRCPDLDVRNVPDTEPVLIRAMGLRK